jgi:hypothetical protein
MCNFSHSWTTPNTKPYFSKSFATFDIYIPRITKTVYAQYDSQKIKSSQREQVQKLDWWRQKLNKSMSLFFYKVILADFDSTHFSTYPPKPYIPDQHSF